MPPVRYYNGFGYRSWTIPVVQVLMQGLVPIQGSPSLSVRTKCVSKEERTWMLVKVEVVLFLHFYVSNREFLILGDSGGPLMSEGLPGVTERFTLIGLVSFGPRTCGVSNFPGVYTRLSAYLSWVLDNMDL